MSKKRNGYGKGTFVESRYLLSSAFLSLGVSGTSPTVSTCSVQMLMLFLLKRRYGIRPGKKSIRKEMVRVDENEFELTYAELSSHGIIKTRAARGFSELLAKGFIEVKHRGGAYDTDKNLYSLSEAFVKWSPGDAPIQVRQSDIRRGFQGKGLGAVSSKNKLSHTPVIPTHTHADDTHPG